MLSVVKVKRVLKLKALKKITGRQIKVCENCKIKN